MAVERGCDMERMLHWRALEPTHALHAPFTFGVPLTENLIAFTTFATEDDAARVARVLVEERLVACANLLPGARSIYRWQEKIADEREVVVVMKTRKQDWAALMSRLH